MVFKDGEPFTDLHGDRQMALVHERGVRWDDPAIGIEWPLVDAPLLSGKDRLGKALGECEVFVLA